MMRRLHISTAALALALATSVQAPPAHAQVTNMNVVCAPGVGCTQLRFNLLSASSAIFVNSLQINLTGGAWRFDPAGGPGNYVARDAFGPFGGFSSINGAGTQLFIDFVGGVGFPFELGAGDLGFIQVEGSSADPAGLAFTYTGALQGGGAIQGAGRFGNAGGGGGSNVTPEPVSMVLLGSGLAGIGAVRRRRRNTKTEV